MTDNAHAGLRISMWDDDELENDLDLLPASAVTSSPVTLLRGSKAAPSSSPTAVPGLELNASSSVDTRSAPTQTPSNNHHLSFDSKRSVFGTEVTANPGSDIDWQLAAAFRARASTLLTGALQSRESMTVEAQRELGRSLILDMLDAAAQEAISGGTAVFDAQQQQQLAKAVFDQMFGLGRMQPLIDDERVENVEIYGDEVLLERSDGSLHVMPPVAENDHELTEFLGFLATRGEGSTRQFSEAHPRLHMRLEDGSRLAATAWITPRPAIVIRRHRLTRVSLEDLVGRGTLTPVMASFLRAAVPAKKSFVVSGAQGGGKTTLIRALCAELDPWERIGTFETEYELHLHEMPEKHRRVVAWEARQGSGERAADGRPAGEITLGECLYDSFRFNLSRQIVGEVRGPEILDMIKAMQSGAGSLSTTHAANAVGAISKLITCALEAGPHVTEAYAQRAIAEHIDLIVHLSLVDTRDADGVYRRQRYVSEIIAVHPGEKGPATTHIFKSDGRQAGTAKVLPTDYLDLVDYGFDYAAFTAEAGDQP